jgi:glutamate dehydrogenase (NADP+)
VSKHGTIILKKSLFYLWRKYMDYELFMENIVKRNLTEKEFIQAVSEVAKSLIPFINARPKYKNSKLLERLTEPDRIIIFRVSWIDDKGDIQVNRGYRVQFSNAIGPYKGGLRFDPSVTLSTFKFLGFEQIFKNALTTLPIGGGKGGADFNPKGKSDIEIMRFCQAYMTELHRYIGENMDVPAGDIGVGAKEIGYLFGQYKKLTNSFTGTLTGKGLNYGGSHGRTEATGYGTVYFAQEMLMHVNDSLERKTCVVSGSGNVAIYTAEKLISLGAKVVTLSDRSGYIYDKEGLTTEKLEMIKQLKIKKKGTLSEYAQKYSCDFFPTQRPWDVPCDAVFPCATQNELHVEDAATLVKNGCRLVSEGANMPTTLEAIDVFRQNGVLFGPGKAANAGGVAISALEMAQNSMRTTWNGDEIHEQLKLIMKSIHDQCVEYGGNQHTVDYVNGANIAGFVKVADAMLAQGVT